jgi:enoyl-CoA hydratase/carnithine racemase
MLCVLDATAQWRDIDGLHFSVTEGVLALVIDRPEKANALTPEMYEGLRRALLLAELDDAVDLVSITATGDRYFVPGGDLSVGAEQWGADLVGKLAAAEGAFPYQGFERCSKVIVTAVNGMCQAAGLIIVLMSDLVLASDRASFRVPELLRGLVDPFVPPRLPMHIGLAKARWMIFTAEELDAHEAERAGLVGKVVAHDELGTELDETIRLVRRTAPGARTRAKRMINTELARIHLDDFLAAMRSPEAVEGMRSFAEKRPPSWRPVGDT